MDYRTEILDLRGALEVLKEMDGQLVETDIEVDPNAELSGVYRYVGAGGTVMRPTRIDGPAMMFHNVKGHKGARVLIGLLASRERVARLFGVKKEDLGKLLCEAALHPVEPVVSEEKAPCQEVVHRVEDEDFDLFRLIPASTNTEMDAGPYITMGMCYATHPDTGCSDVTIHRMCIQSKDELSIFLQPGSRHIGAMAERATELGQPLPISISIGVDPAIEVGSCFEPPTTPMGYNELSIAGAIRRTPVVLTPCVSIRENAIANAEYVIEGEIQPGVRVVEDQNFHTGYAMPEFPGYNGHASDECWLIKVKAVTHRRNPIMQTVIGPSEEHVNLAGIPTEASIYNMINKALPGKVTNVYAHPAGGLDMAVGYQMSICGVLCAMMIMYANIPIPIAVLATILISILFGMLGTLLEQLLQLPRIFVSIGLSTVYQGIVYVITNSKTISSLPQGFKVIGQGTIFHPSLTYATIFMVIAGIIMSFVMDRTYFGRYVFALGGNEAASRLAGINVRKMKFAIGGIAGLFCGIGAVVLTARVGAAAAATAAGTEITVLTGVLVGGVSVRGGEGKIANCVAGVLIMGLLANGMQLAGLNTYYQYVAKGAIMLLVMWFDAFQIKRRAIAANKRKEETTK